MYSKGIDAVQASGQTRDDKIPQDVPNIILLTAKSCFKTWDEGFSK